jgi:hypothetical protein
VIRYYTAAEIRDIYRATPAEVTIAEIYRLANEHGWHRARDRQRPALYDADDVEATMTALATRRLEQLDKARRETDDLNVARSRPRCAG